MVAIVAGLATLGLSARVLHISEFDEAVSTMKQRVQKLRRDGEGGKGHDTI
jgi:hypothetical protein